MTRVLHLEEASHGIIVEMCSHMRMWEAQWYVSNIPLLCVLVPHGTFTSEDLDLPR